LYRGSSDKLYTRDDDFSNILLFHRHWKNIRITTFAAVVGLAGTLIVGLIMGSTIGLVQLLKVLALSPLIYLSAGVLSSIPGHRN